MIVGIAVSAIPASEALIKRDYSYLSDSHLTARFGNTKVCGDHLCKPGEWDKLQAKLNAAQVGNQTTSNTTTTMPTTPSTTQTPSGVCQEIQNLLEGIGTSQSTISKVMTDLNCPSS